MKRIITSILVFMFFAPLAIAGTTFKIPQIHTTQYHTNGTPAAHMNNLANGTIVVILPHAEDKFTVYDHIKIKWRFAMGHIAQKCVSIDLYKGSRKIKTLSNKICAKYFKWKIPNNIATGRYKIKITTKDKKISSYSNVFHITKPDLYIGQNGIKIAPKHPSEGEIVSVKITIKNGGKAKANPSIAQVTCYKSDKKTAVFNKLFHIGTIQPNAKSTISFNLQSYKENTIKVKLDRENHLAESNKKNNEKEYSFSANPKARLGLCIDTGKRPRPGKETTIRAYVVNLGDAASTATSINIDIYGLHTKRYRFLIPSIPPHGVDSSAHLRYKWTNLLSKKENFSAYFINGGVYAKGTYILTRHGGKHGGKNKIKCNFGEANRFAVDRNNYFKIYHLHY